MTETFRVLILKSIIGHDQESHVGLLILIPTKKGEFSHYNQIKGNPLE